MATKLDRDKPFAEIYGVLPNHARFEQDGHQFDAEGRQVQPLHEVEAALAEEHKTKGK